MLKFFIKTHKKGTIYSKPHLFLLNKGMNSGKPQKEPFINSFVIIFENDSDFDTINLTAYALWKTKFWHQFLSGSVIPFLRLNDVRKEFSTKVNQEIKDHKEHVKNVETLKLLEQSEKRFHENLNLINDMRRVILFRYISK
ncbi:hypothetical protein CJ739_3703 [Mariniflexile rhizosphaerae]|uniref:DUF6943 family protein n=1 Tax=unclassified Mariniflexile TaxID=2643887 RepID=UPI000E333F71|nr:hypothetical protein [Mariniflexile sp. TRM1-10]AXP82764.1 hypothetical protein CJ739_3703 [Mariniflexile sp. TRM1-10]